jgi:TRAP-type mannitol/chloroaromatic compound transport system permease large subunit
MRIFVMKGLASKDTTMADLYRAAAPFIVRDLVIRTLVALFPPLTLRVPFGH